MSKKKLLTLIIIFLTTIILVPKPGGEGVNLARTSTIKARKSSVNQQLSAIKTKTILFGNGLFSKQNSLMFINKKNNQDNLIKSHSRIPDNFFVNVLLSLGLVGLLLTTISLIKWFIYLTKINPIFSIALLAILISGQFNNSVFQPFVLLIMLLGISSIEKI